MTPERMRQARRAGLALLAVAALLVPFFAAPYTVGELTLVLVYAVSVLGLNLLVGYAGQISLGHGAFFAIGAYTTAVLVAKAGVPHLLTIPIAGLVGFVAGFLFGVPALRVRGTYLALITLALAVAFPPVIRKLGDLTGGSQGLSLAAPVAPAWLGLEQDQFLYLLVLAVAVPMVVAAVNLVGGESGRAIRAVRDQEIAARTMGVDLARVKTRMFAISAMYAGVAGALYAFAIAFVAPESFTLTLSFAFLTAAVIGGLGTISGAVFGAFFLLYVPRWAAEVDQALTGVVYGVLLIGAMYAFRGGIAGALRQLEAKVVRVQAPALARGPAAPAGTQNERIEEVR